MTSRLVQIGSSLAVTLPSAVVREFKLKKGQEVEVDVHQIAGTVTIRLGVKLLEDGKVTTPAK
jgi:antitoxin component of MazEF toxin-antitoxin module